MSDAVAPAKEHERDDAGPPPPPLPTYRLLDRVRWIGYVLLGLQGVGFLIWSVILYQHFSLTSDYSQYNQALFEVAHGNFYPYSTMGYGDRYLRNDAELFIYVLAPLYWVFRSGLLLPVAQDLSLVSAEVVGFTWLCDLAKRHCGERDAALLAGLGLLLFVVSPWQWWTVSFDAHMEPLVSFFAVYMAWDLSRGKRRAFVWALPVLLGGAVTTTYVIGIGLGGVLVGRRTRRMGAALTFLGIGCFLVISLLHLNGAAAYESHRALARAHYNPFGLLQMLWDQRTDIIANLAPGGLLGIAVPIIMPVAIGIILSDTLSAQQFSEPLFQNVLLYVLLPIGTVAVLAWLLRRHRWTALVLAGVVAAQAIGWSAVWAPRTQGQWMRISTAEAATLGSVLARIPGSAEVVVSQGVLGRFSWSSLPYPIYGGKKKIPVRAGTWFVITPTSGIETASPAESMGLIGELAGPLHATLVTHGNGVWAFRLNPPPGVRSVTVPSDQSPLPAWAGEGAAGVPVLEGPVSDWHMAATGAKGYVVDGIQWQETPGRYLATVTMSTTSAVNVEVWNDTGNVLVARQHVLPGNGIQTVALPVNATVPYQGAAYSGWGPFRAEFVHPPAGERLEVRVWSPGKALVNVYNADLTSASAP